MVLTELTVALVAASVYFFFRTRRLIGGFTSIAALSSAWTLLSLLLAAASSSCPGFSTTSCTTAQLAANALLGALIPLVPVVLLYPARLIWKAFKSLGKVLATYARWIKSPNPKKSR